MSEASVGESRGGDDGLEAIDVFIEWSFRAVVSFFIIIALLVFFTISTVCGFYCLIEDGELRGKA